MRVSTNARRGSDLAKSLLAGEWLPDIPPEKKRAATLGACVISLLGVGGAIALLWLTHSF
jgi:hypothetical protein